jgi:O-antigen ligase
LLLIISVTDGFVKHLSGGSVTYVLKDGMLLLILVGLMVRSGFAGKTVERTPAKMHGVLIWAVYMLYMLTQMLHPATSFAGALGAFRAHAWFGLLFIVGFVYFRKRERFPQIVNIAIGVCVLGALSAFVQHAFNGRWMELSPGFAKASTHYASFPSAAAKAAGVQGASYRMYGTLVDPAALGLSCAYGIVMAMAALARSRGIWRWLNIAAIPLLGTALVISQTRSAMFGCGMGVIMLTILLALRPSTRRFALGGLVLIALALPLGFVLTNGRIADRVFSADQVGYAAKTRDVSRNQVIYELPMFPFGHGLGSTGAGGNLRDDNGLAVDNVYFATLYETGIPGLALFLLMQIGFLYLGIRAAVRSNNLAARTAFIGLSAAQFGLLFSCWFTQGAFDYAPVAQMFWLFTGAIARSDGWE